MSIRKLHTDKELVYFCSFTCYNWLHLFELTNFYSEIYNWFEILRKKRIEVIGYVIMPNHIHILLYYPDIKQNINQVIGAGKRFMAYEIVRRLKDQSQNYILQKLAEGVDASERKKGKLHQMFEPSADIKPCHSEKMIEEKLDYIHHNPVSGKWKLVDDYVDYEHSSASYYELGKQGSFKILHYKEVGFAESPSGDSAVG